MNIHKLTHQGDYYHLNLYAKSAINGEMWKRLTGILSNYHSLLFSLLIKVDCFS